MKESEKENIIEHLWESHSLPPFNFIKRTKAAFLQAIQKRYILYYADTQVYKTYGRGVEAAKRRDDDDDQW